MHTEQRRAGFRLLEQAVATEFEIMRSEVFEGPDGGEFGFRVELQFVRDADYIRGRRMKTRIDVPPAGLVVIDTQGRGKSAEHWLARLRGARQLRPIGE